MTAIVLRGLAARKLRAVLTALAVVLGVAMIAGTYVQTDQIKQAFVDIEQASNAGRDVVVTRKPPLDSAYTLPEAIDDSLLERLRSVPGVAQADGQLWTDGRLREGDKSFTTGMAPAMMVSTVPDPYNPFRVAEGRSPERRGEVMVNREMAESEHLKLGGRYEVETRNGLHPVTLVGWFDYGNGASFGGANTVAASLGDVQLWSDLEGKVTTVFASAEEGVTPSRLATRVQGALPADYEVLTGTEQAAADAKEINDAIGGFLTPMLLAFGAAAVLVGAFIIFNTFSITVAQRTREFALLRALGAARRQIMLLVAGEALLIGLLASVVGLAAGVGFALLIGNLFDAMGIGIPRSDVIVAQRTVVAAFAVGMGVTLLAALAPALRATRVPPIMALQGVTATKRSRFAVAVAILATLGGVGMLAAGLLGGGAATARMGMMGGGAVLMFVGIALNARYVVRPVAGVIGLPLDRLFHTTGRLARENAMRNPGRTATTSAALMVGLGLVIFVAVLANGMKASMTSSIDKRVTAQLVVGADSNTEIPGGAVDVLKKVEGVSTTSPLYVDQLKVGRDPLNFMTDIASAIDASTLGAVYDIDWIKGSDALLAQLAAGDNILIEEQFGKEHGVKVGDRFTVTSTKGRALVTAIGEYRDPQLVQGTILDLSLFSKLSASRDPWVVFTGVEDGADVSSVQQAIAGALEPFPAAKVQTLDAYKDDMSAQLDQLVYLLYALLAMSVVISLFGIANSLFLSIHERTREFGLLRAIGTTGRQVRRIVRYESVITAVIGGLLGTLVGILLAWLMTLALSDFGLGFEIPLGQLAGFLVLAVIVGVLGAVFPARRGSRIDVLEALRHE